MNSIYTDITGSTTMLDIDAGPSRRISKSRKRSSSTTLPSSQDKDRNCCHQNCHGNKQSEDPSARRGEEKIQKVPVKVSPEKSDWFCNSFDSRAKRKRKSYSNVPETSQRDAEKRQGTSIKKKTLTTQPSELTAGTNALETSDFTVAEIVVDGGLSNEKDPVGQNQRDIPILVNDIYNRNEEESFMTQTQDVENTVVADNKFQHVNDSLAVIKVRRVSNDSVAQSQSQYFQSQTPLTAPIPDRFLRYKPSQKSTKKEITTENKVTKCQGRICTPFSFSFIGCDTQCSCDVSLNDSVNVNHQFTQNYGTYTQDQVRYNKSQMVPKCSQSRQELVSGSQYHLRSSTQLQITQDNSQIQSTSVFNQTGLIVDSQDNDETSDCDIFEDSFNNSAVLSQIDDLDAGARAKLHDSVRKRDSKRTLVETDPDISSHTQSLIGSYRDSNSGEHGKRRHRKSSLENDIALIEIEMQRQRNNSRLNSVAVERQSDVLRNIQNSHLNASVGAETENKSSQRSSISGIDHVKHTELAENDVEKGVSLIHDSAVNIGVTKEKSVTNERRVAAAPVTPVVAESLQDRLKKRLQENASNKTPHGPGSLVQQLREQVLERVQLEAAMIQARNQTSDDIGPFYGLPSKVKQLFETQRGIKTLYDWQDECLKLPAITERKNLIYSLPTSGGKTLVAEILILQEILCRKKDAVLILPFVSIVQEKVRNLSQFAVDLDFLVEEYAGSKGRFPPISRRKKNSLYIATIEKAHSIVNSLTENKRMDSLGLVVVDELHMIGEGGSRGATLESTLMKILHSNGNIQIIGMSATLNNIEDLQQFLNAEVYTNDFRPVQLTETIKLSDNIYSVNTKAKCPEDQFLHDRIVCFQYKPEMEKTDPDHLFGLVLEIIPDNSCLVFCPTKKNCENVAMMLSKMMVEYKRELSDVQKQERKALLKELYNDAAGKICPVLQYTIHFGIAYHHSGLTMDERKLIEEAYIEGTLCLLACTSTLAAGVNLPAKRVILRCPYVGQYFINRSQYKQMVGRAGRAGIDTSGESILICKTNDREKICDLLAGPLESCHSSLVYDGGKGVRNLILSTIGLQITPSTEDVFKFMAHSLAKLQQNFLNVDILELCKDCLQKLIDLGLVVQTRHESDEGVEHSLDVSDLGRATFKGPIDPDYAGRLYKDLKAAEEPLVLSTHLHLLYLVTPYDMVKDISPSWLIYFTQMNSLSPAELKVPALIGIPESYLARKAAQQKSKLKVDEFVVNRFYLTLMLYDLWKQKTIWDVAEKFQQPRGFIQNLLSSAASFASCVAHFCQELKEFWAYQDLMGNFVKRLSYCVTAELIPLMEIPGVKLGRAKLMYNAGFRTLSAIASADPEVLISSVEHLPRKVAKQIVASAKLLLNEKAEAMMEEVEQLVTVPEGIATSSAAMATTVAAPALVTPSMSQNSTDSQ